MTAPGAIVESAPAKVNLYLHVVGKRDDGYHLLDSLAVFVDVADTVSVHPAPARVALRGVSLPPSGPRLAMSGPYSQALAGESPQRNLVLRAAYALATLLERDAEVIIALEKRLPVASGIGGGSSDGAATLRALSRLWGVEPEDPRLYLAAASLGADAPVCLAARPCFMGGVGELLTEAPHLPDAWMVLANPGVAVATPAVFKSRRGGFSAPARFEQSPADLDELVALLAERGNDLTDAARHLCPVIGEVLARLGAAQGSRLARMSGSGATCFALFASEDDAKAAAAELAADQPGWWVKAGRMLPRPAGSPPLPDPDFFDVLTAAAGKIELAPPPAAPFPDTGGWGVG